MEDYEGALDYYQQALKGQEKVLALTHPDTLRTIMNMACTSQDGLKDFEDDSDWDDELESEEGSD